MMASPRQPDDETPARLEREALVVAASRWTYAVGRLVLWSRDASLVDARGDLGRIGNKRADIFCSIKSWTNNKFIIGSHCRACGNGKARAVDRGRWRAGKGGDSIVA